MLDGDSAQRWNGLSHDEILADYEDLEREDLLAVLAFAARLSQTKRRQPVTTCVPVDEQLPSRMIVILGGVSMLCTRFHGRLVCLLLAWGATTCSCADEMSSWLERNHGQLIATYREFHKQPELSHKEVKTAERLAAELKKTGAEVTTGVGGTGVVAVIKNGGGPTVLLRTDLDALPVQEKTGFVFS